MYTFTELINRKLNWTYSRSKRLLSGANLNIPRAVSRRCDSTTASDRRYTTGEIYSTIPYDRDGKSIYFSAGKVVLMKDFEESERELERTILRHYYQHYIYELNKSKKRMSPWRFLCHLYLATGNQVC